MKITKRLGVLAAACVFALGYLSSCSANKGRVYKIAVDIYNPPYAYQESKTQNAGLSLAVFRAIAQDQGFSYELAPMGFDACLLSLKNKQTDGMLAACTITERRREVYDFSEPYYQSSVVMAVGGEAEGPVRYDQLKGATVAVRMDSVGERLASAIQESCGFRLLRCRTFQQMADAVLNGQAAACFEEESVVSDAIAHGSDLKVLAGVPKEQGNAYSFAVLKGANAELLALFDAGLKNIQENGVYQKIVAQYGLPAEEETVVS